MGIHEILDKTGINYQLYSSLSLNMRNFLCNCVRFNVPNPSSRFKENDIVIRKFNKKIDADPYGIPFKWKVIATSYGLLICRRLMGSRLGKIEVVNDVVHAFKDVEIEIDPDYIENILLQGGEFDPSSRRKASLKLRSKASKFNRSISRFIRTTEEAWDFLETLREGDKFFTSRSLIGLTVNPVSYTVVSVNPTKSSKKPVLRPLRAEPLDQELDSVIVEESNCKVNTRMLVRSIVGHFVASKEPYPLMKVLNA